MTPAVTTCRTCGAATDRSHRFCSACGSAIINPDDGPMADPAERRQLTVVFIDIVASTALAERLGDEKFRDLVRECRARAATACHKYGGVLAHYFGDGLLVYFGYPKAQEADARRAVQASLELQAMMAELSFSWERSAGVGVQLRVAVHTGRVIAGDISAGPVTERLAIIGSVPNTAARLQECAEPGSVTISQATFDLVTRAFACTPLGRRSLRGVSEPVAIFRVDGPARSVSPFGARADHARMIGRDRELGLLLEAWARVQQGGSEIVVIEAEAGMGKSRLIAELLARIDRRMCRQVLLQCSLMFSDTVLHPICEYISASFGLEDHLDADEWLVRLRQGLMLAERDVDEYVALLSPLLGLKLPAGDGRRTAASPQQERELLHRRLIDWFLNEADGRPVLLVVEDLHWADPSTLELLTKAAKDMGSAQVLMVVSTRPQAADAPSLGGARATSMQLVRLEEAEASLLIDLIAHDRQLSSTAIGSLRSRTDGVPLFIEEMTRAVMEAGAKGAGALLDPDLTIPSTLQESLTARIDHVAVDRELLHLCATLGREFGHDVLAACWSGPPKLMEAELDKLIAADLLTARRWSGTIRYTFRHALIQEAIYGFQLGPQRRHNHGRIAAVLARDLPKLLEATPEIVAAHHLQAGDELAALPLLQRAAKIALQRSAIPEALNHLRRALQMLRRMPDRASRIQQELELLCSLGVTLSSHEGFASDEAGQIFGEALEICRRAGRPAGFFPALHGLYRYNVVRGHLRVATEISGEMLAIGRRQRDAALLVEGHRAAGFCRFLKPARVKASFHFQRTMRHYDPEAHREHRVLYGTDPSVVASSMEALVAQLGGEPERANRLAERVIGEAEAIEHPYSLCWALAVSAVVFQVGGAPDRVRSAADRLAGIARRHEFGLWEANAAIFLGWFAAVHGGDPSAIAAMQNGIAEWRRAGSAIYVPYFMYLLAEGHRQWGDLDESERVLSAALDRAVANDEMWWVPQIERLRREVGHSAASPGAGRTPIGAAKMPAQS